MRRSQGPRLPHIMVQELQGDPAGGAPSQKQKGKSTFHVSERKAARKAARKQKGSKNYTQSSISSQPSPSLPTKRAGVANEGNGPPPKKRRMDPMPLHHAHDSSNDSESNVQQEMAKQSSRRQRPVKTKFNELLTADVLKGTDAKAVAAEADLQRQLAKKLGIRVKQKELESTADVLDDLFKDDFMGSEDGSEDELDEQFSDEEQGDDSDEDSSFQLEHSDSEDNTEASEDLMRSREHGIRDNSLPNEFSEEDLRKSELADSDESEMSEGSKSGLEEEDSLNLQHQSRILNAVRSSGDESDEDPPGVADSMLEKPGKVPSSLEKSQPPIGKYVPPAGRTQMQVDTAKANLVLRKRLTGLINKLSDANLPGVAREILTFLDTESRREVADICSELLLQAVAEGPRATETFTAVTAAFISGVSARGDCIEFGANFTSALAQRLERSLKEEDSLAASNLGNLMSHLYMCGLVSAGLVFSLLERLRAEFQEQDVALIHLILKSCGLKLRAQDSVQMKEFVMGIHATAAEHKGKMSQRTEILLELVVDIKNNRKSKSAANHRPMEAYQSQGTQRWLRESKVEDFQLRNLAWKQLLDPQKKGLWWLPSAADQETLSSMTKALREESQQFGEELLQLAAKQRMNTDVRRAVFCVIMGSEDFVDASERLLRLPLKGESQREIVRVAMECCLQETDWNPFYAALLKNVLQSSQAHCVTAQFCIWDNLKVLKGQQPRRTANLARLIASLILSKALPFTALRAANLDALGSAEEKLFWQMFFERVLQGAKNTDGLAALLRPVAQPHLQKFAAAMSRYLQEDFKHASGDSETAERTRAFCKTARKILNGFKRTV